MNKYLLFFATFLVSACTKVIERAPQELMDHDLETYITKASGRDKILFQFEAPGAMLSYRIYSSGESPKYDPYSWTLKGSLNRSKWVEIDRQDDQLFCSRYQEKSFAIQNPGSYKYYMLEIEAQDNDTFAVADFHMFTDNVLQEWDRFNFPDVKFEVLDPQTKGAGLYEQLVQNPDDYIRHHALKVAQILFHSDKDTMNRVEQISYQIKDYEGISAKSGQPPVISIVYSTKHIEHSALESMYKLDYETRGVLFHELVHAYQFEPKGIGTYSTNKEFWACIEGLADAVRTEAGFFDVEDSRHPGGHWLDGYRTTGFFLQWLTTKDPDAIRKFHLTVRDLPIWSFDGAMKQVFGPDSGIDTLWSEYQEYLTLEQAK
jgi:hypothetical protein